ncbi:MAG: helix-turn-helix transcriptional regulator [Clostridia bacterium]|nr:helix-turn-helix transcriptional regulator [Clostridia bacterium]
MILADKIIKQRKKNGWSQEELAYKMNVSRQAVSKWESAQTIPDLDKIMLLGELFGVTTDYLLKDSIEDEEIAEVAEEKPVRKISLEYANTYLAVQKKNSWLKGVATFLCILSPVVLIIFGGLSALYEQDYESFTIFGLVSFFAFIISAVPMFIVAGHNNEPYKFLDKIEPFDLEYGVKGIIEEKQKQMSGAFKKWNIAGVCTLIFAPIPVIVEALVENFSERVGLVAPFMMALMLLIAGIASSIFVVISVQKSAMQKLLREEDYTDRGKKRSQLRDVVSFAYWMVVVVAYLVWSLVVADGWAVSWILLAAAGMLYPVLVTICNYITDKKIEKENKDK